MSDAPDPALVREVLRDAGEPDPGPDLALERLAGGASRESWVVAGRYVLKRDHPTETDPPRSGLKELAALRAAQAAGVPVPRPVAGEPEGGRLGTCGYLAELVEGTASPRKLLALEPAARTQVARDLGAALRRLATVDPAAVVEVPDEPPVAAALHALGREIERIAPDRPVFALVLRRLELDPPEEAAPVLVHGDFRVGNFLVHQGRLRALVDWEFCRAGDPAEDLGFLCLRPWRFGADAQRAGGLAGLDAVLAGHGGDGVDPARVRFWEAVGQLRWGLYCLEHAAGFAAGRHRHLERAVLGRRVSEVEWDLLDLVGEGVAA